MSRKSYSAIIIFIILSHSPMFNFKTGICNLTLMFVRTKSYFAQCTIFPVDSSETKGEGRKPLIRTRAAPVSRYYKSHVSSKCITLQQESQSPTLQRQVHNSTPAAPP